MYNNEKTINLGTLYKAYDNIQTIMEIFDKYRYNKYECLNKIAEILDVSLPDYTQNIGKWAAFTNEGMAPILHGKIVKIDTRGIWYMKCKNGAYRFATDRDIIKVCDTKAECYSIITKNMEEAKESID